MREDLEQLLDGAVLAARAVQGDEGDLGALGLQARDQIGADVDRQRLVAEREQRVLDPGAAAQRDLPLQPPAALEYRDPHDSPERRNGTTEPSADPGRPRRRSRGGGRNVGYSVLAGDRPVQLHLLLDHGADPLDPLADPIRGRGGEVEPHRRAPAPVGVGRGSRDEGDVFAQRPRQQVRRVDVGGQRRPAEEPSGRARPGRLRREEALERVQHRVAPLAVDVAQVADVVAPTAPRRSTRGRSTGSGSTCRGPPPACRAPPSPSPAAARTATRAGSRARGSSRRCPGRGRSRRRRACRAARPARPRSAAGRTGCPRPPAARARGRSRPGAVGARPTSSPRRGSGSWARCR